MDNLPFNSRIKDMQILERPRERLARMGAGVLSTAELLAILLRVGVEGENAIQVGQRLLQEFNGLAGLQRASYTEICAQHGIGEAKAAQIKAAIDLGRRLASQSSCDRPVVHSPEDAADLVQYEMSALDQEQLRVILLNTRNHVLGVKTIYQGSLNSSQVRIGELFRPAIRENAAAIIIIHNHPSGDPSPSPDDVAITKAIIDAGKLLDIQVLDHLIIGANKFISLNRRGLGFDGGGEMEIIQEVHDKRRVVAVSKPLPKLLQDLYKVQKETAEEVKCAIDKQGTVVATTLDIKPQKREQGK